MSASRASRCRIPDSGTCISTAVGTLRGDPGDVLRGFRFEHFEVTLTADRLALGVVEDMAWTNVSVNGRPYVPPTAPAAKP